MSRKKVGVVGSVTKKIWATGASLVATLAASLAAYFWADLVQLIPGAAAPNPSNPQSPLVAQVVGSLVNREKAKNTIRVEMLGCEVMEENGRIVVAEVDPGSPSALLGLKPGDIIETIDQRPIASTEALNGSLARSRQLFSSILHVRRDGAVLQGDVVRQEDKLTVRRPLAP